MEVAVGTLFSRVVTPLTLPTMTFEASPMKRPLSTTPISVVRRLSSTAGSGMSITVQSAT